MGTEANCKAVYDGNSFHAIAHLESDHLLVKGDHRVKVMLADLTTCQADAETLHLTWSDHDLELELGPTAAKWAEKIKNPKSLLDKLDIKPGSTNALEGSFDAEFVDQLKQRGIDTVDSNLGNIDTIFYEVDSLADLERLTDLKARLKPSGAIWIVAPKGKSAVVKDHEIITAARTFGLLDTKVANFSTTHTAIKFVISTADRRST